MDAFSYALGRKHALVKLGVLSHALLGAATGALSGYAMSPQDREGQGTLSGAALGGLGAIAGNRFSSLLHSNTSKLNPLAVKAMPHLGAGLGALTGIGLSQLAINKNQPDTSEDPYQYSRK